MNFMTCFPHPVVIRALQLVYHRSAILFNKMSLLESTARVYKCFQDIFFSIASEKVWSTLDAAAGLFSF